MKKSCERKTTARDVSRHLLRSCAVVAVLLRIQVAQANPLEELQTDVDIPEEILRTEIIVEARSPLTGELMTAAEYAQLQAELEREGRPPQLSSEIRQLVYLLRLRRIVKPIIPFIKEEQGLPSKQ